MLELCLNLYCQIWPTLSIRGTHVYDAIQNLHSVHLWGIGERFHGATCESVGIQCTTACGLIGLEASFCIKLWAGKGVVMFCSDQLLPSSCSEQGCWRYIETTRFQSCWQCFQSLNWPLCTLLRRCLSTSHCRSFFIRCPRHRTVYVHFQWPMLVLFWFLCDLPCHAQFGCSVQSYTVRRG